MFGSLLTRASRAHVGEALRSKDVERFWSRVAIGSADECWPWQRGVNQSGYGQISIEGKQLGAHRVSYELHYGPIPTGLHILHTCDNPACVNPAHLCTGTHGDNVQDAIVKGRMTGRKRSDTCKYGHPWTEENTYSWNGSHRACRTCQRERRRVAK